MQLPQLAIDRTVTPITCNFEFVITDKQDKLIMFKHSQEVREFILNINFRGLFVISCFVSANGKEIFL